MNNRHYWNDKEERAKYALQHTEDMERTYFGLIQDSVFMTSLYGVPYNQIPSFETIENSKFPIQFYEKPPIILLDDLDSCSAIMKHREGKTAVLNFASYKNPGGMFLKGSSAQEESLCHDSFLYNVLSKFEDYYSFNRKNLNKGLYLDRALYCPNVLFNIGEMHTFCDVITCAAPNRAANIRNGVTEDENNSTLFKRIGFILDIAAIQRVETLILGAYGCGVFHQNPLTVSSFFKYYLDNDYRGLFKKVIFAIPDSNSYNFEMFDKVLQLNYIRTLQ